MKTRENKVSLYLLWEINNRFCELIRSIKMFCKKMFADIQQFYMK